MNRTLLTLGQLSLTTGWLAKDSGAVTAGNNGGSMGEDGAVVRTRSKCQKNGSRDLEASRALDVHEERVWLRDDLLKLVGSGVNVRRSVEEIDSESLGLVYVQAGCDSAGLRFAFFLNTMCIGGVSGADAPSWHRCMQHRCRGS